MIFKNPPKKSLGQNFLIDGNIRRKIIDSCQISKKDNIVEIGPGTGLLTKGLVLLAKSVIAVEKDSKLCEQLSNLLKDYNNLKIINADFLKYKIKGKNIKVVGNIPYYITSPIIEHLVNQKYKIDSIYITIQKEVAERIVAKPGGKDYGSFSIFVQYHFMPQIKFIIKKTCFSPQPKVDSAFLELKVRKDPAVRVKSEELFFKIIRAAFSQRRKMISNTLKTFLDTHQINNLKGEIGTMLTYRPECLSMQDFAKIADFVLKFSL